MKYRNIAIPNLLQEFIKKKETQKCEINLSMYIYKLEANLSLYILDVNLPNRKTVETEIPLKYIYI
jgi:hypothetical protein